MFRTTGSHSFESSARRAILFAVFAIVLLGGTAGTGDVAAARGQVFQAPAGRVENVRFERGAGDVITVFYDLASEQPRAVFNVTLKASQDGGKTFDVVPRTVTGDVGTAVRPGAGKKIVWEAGRDLENPRFDQFRFTVVAVAGVLEPIPAEAPASKTPSRGTLVISSEPSGAGVVVDGTSRGKTPLTVSDLPPGDHRVKLTREGYLDNEKPIQIEAGKISSVDVKLTAAAAPAAKPPVAKPPATAPATPGSTPPAKAAKGGSKLKWILPIAGGAAAAGVAVAAKGGGGSGGPPQQPLCSADFTMTPAGVGLAAVTVFTFSASQPTCGTRYTWGGAIALQGPTVTQVFDYPQSYLVSLEVQNATGVAEIKKTLTVKSMTGGWSGTVNANPPVTFSLQLTQNRAQISGSYTDKAGTASLGRFGLSDPRNVSLIFFRSNVEIELALKGSDDLNTFTGTSATFGGAGVTMTRQ